jgi:hypothetical protein
MKIIYKAIRVAVALCVVSVAWTVPQAQAQTGKSPVEGESDPASALAGAFSAACRLNEPQFAKYLTADSAKAFEALPVDQKTAFMKRLSLQDEAGKPLISSDQANRPVVRCAATEGTSEYRFGETRAGENLAFIPVSVINGEQTVFGLVREGGGWRLISLGLVLLDIPQLSKQWALADLAATEEGAVQNLRVLEDAIKTYLRAFGKLPDSLSELGPAPKDQISPEQANLVSAKLSEGNQAGYQFRYRIVPGSDADDAKFELAATPTEYGHTGRKSFFLDSSGKLHGADKRGAVATFEDSLLPGEKAE